MVIGSANEPLNVRSVSVKGGVTSRNSKKVNVDWERSCVGS